MDCSVPVTLRVFVQRGEHNGQDDFDVVANKVAEVLVVPEVQCSLGDLEVRTGADNSSLRALSVEAA